MYKSSTRDCFARCCPPPIITTLNSRFGRTGRRSDSSDWCFARFLSRILFGVSFFASWSRFLTISLLSSLLHTFCSFPNIVRFLKDPIPICGNIFFLACYRTTFDLWLGVGEGEGVKERLSLNPPSITVTYIRTFSSGDDQDKDDPVFLSDALIVLLGIGPPKFLPLISRGATTTTTANDCFFFLDFLSQQRAA